MTVRHLNTALLHQGFERTAFAETAEPFFLTSGFVYHSAEEAEATFNGDIVRHQYTRYTNPTTDVLENRLCMLEGAERCLSTATGMAAVYGALAGILSAGQHIVAARAMFGSCLQVITNVLPRFGITYQLIDGTNLDEWRAALQTPTHAVFVEMPANPMLQVSDLPAICNLAHAAGALVVVDSALAAPGTIKPLQHGADVVIYSLTKHADGQGRVMGGAVLGKKLLLEEKIMPFLRHTGSAISPYNAGVIGQSLITLPLRMEKQASNALQLAQALEKHPAVERVSYPHLPSHAQYDLAKKLFPHGGTMIALTVRGGKEAAFKVMNACKLFLVSNNLGDARSLVTHPVTTTHRGVPPADRALLGIADGTMRLSVGLEDSADLINDLTDALNGLGG